MDNQFFRQKMPYLVECTADQIIVKSRSYAPLFIGKRPKDLNVHAFLESFSAFPVPLDDTKAYLYDDTYNPVANVEAYNQKLFEYYAMLLAKLTKSLAGIEPY